MNVGVITISGFVFCRALPSSGLRKPHQCASSSLPDRSSDQRGRFAVAVAAIVSCVVFPSLVRDGEAQDDTVRVEGRVAWIAGAEDGRRSARPFAGIGRPLGGRPGS
jgi:hypothetical protein